MNLLSWLSICIPDINVHMSVSQLLDFLDDANLAIEFLRVILPLSNCKPLLTGQASNIVFESFQDALAKLC